MKYANILAASAVMAFTLNIGCSPTPTASFSADVKPVLDRYCAECHLEGGKGSQESGFRVDSHELVMKGTRYGPVIVPGDAISSSLYRLVVGKVDPSIRMPHGKEKLSEKEIEAVKSWIAQGAKND
jgi:hypothetical protein